jgi:hypothetical protein
MAGAALGAGVGAIKGAKHWEHLTIPAYVAVQPSRTGVTFALIIPF